MANSCWSRYDCSLTNDDVVDVVDVDDEPYDCLKIVSWEVFLINCFSEYWEI